MLRILHDLSKPKISGKSSNKEGGLSWPEAEKEYRQQSILVSIQATTNRQKLPQC